MSRLQQEIKQTRPFSSLAEETFLNLQRTADRLLAGEAEVLARHDLTPPQYNVLRILRGAGDQGLPCNQIADRMVTADPDITRLLDRLETKRLVRRQRCQEDRRQVHCWITAEGLALLDRLDEPVRLAIRGGFKSLSRATASELVGLLDRVRAGFRDGAS